MVRTQSDTCPTNDPLLGSFPAASRRHSKAYPKSFGSVRARRRPDGETLCVRLTCAAVVTMSTTGYGDLVPSSKLGKVVAAVCAIYGLVMLSFPIALLGTRFTEEWKTFKFEQLEEADRKGLETGGVKRRLEHTPKEIAEKLRVHIAHIDKVLVEAQVLHRST